MLGFASPFHALSQSIFSPLTLISKTGTQREWWMQKCKALVLIIILATSWRVLALSIVVMLTANLLVLLKFHRPTGTRVNMTPQCPADITPMFNANFCTHTHLRGQCAIIQHTCWYRVHLVFFCDLKLLFFKLEFEKECKKYIDTKPKILNTSAVKSFCLHNICVRIVYIYYVYINTHVNICMHVYI